MLSQYFNFQINIEKFIECLPSFTRVKQSLCVINDE